jgi:hypothetical protein
MARLCGEICIYENIGSSSIESLHNKYTSDIVGNVVYDDLIQPVVTIYLGAQAVCFQ